MKYIYLIIIYRNFHFFILNSCVILWKLENFFVWLGFVLEGKRVYSEKKDELLHIPHSRNHLAVSHKSYFVLY